MKTNKTQTMKAKQVKNTRKNKSWLRNPDQLKTPKIFNVQMMRNKDGSFHIIGNGAAVLDRKNQHSAVWTSVDVRDLACEMRNNSIRAF
jgi:hypothetical protein